MSTNDIFYKEDDGQPTNTRKPVGVSRPSKVDESEQQTVATPPGYIKVKLSSIGKLSAPRAIHVKDYSGEDAWNLSLSSADTVLTTILSCLQDMIYEDIDPSLLHENEVEEILFNVLLNYWTPVLSEFPYPWEEEELEDLSEEKRENIRKGIEVPRVDIDISKLKTNPLPKDFKEPIIWEDKELQVGFILPRIGHYITASDYIEQKYGAEEEKFSQIEDDIKYNSSLKDKDPRPKRTIDRDYLREYREYNINRNADFLKVKHCMMLHSFKGEELKSVSEKLKVYPEVGLRIWTDISNLIESELNFGVEKNIEVKSPITGKKVIRRYQFRFKDVIPNVKHKEYRKSNIRFGN